jgi:hypothetical protein
MFSKRYLFNTNKCIIKQLLNSVFAICKIIKVSVTVISLAIGSADNAYLDLDNSAYHKNHIQSLLMKAGVIRATKLLQLATKSDFNAC